MNTNNNYIPTILVEEGYEAFIEKLNKKTGEFEEVPTDNLEFFSSYGPLDIRFRKGDKLVIYGLHEYDIKGPTLIQPRPDIPWDHSDEDVNQIRRKLDRMITKDARKVLRDLNLID